MSEQSYISTIYQGFQHAAAGLNTHAPYLDSLNVFPVADKDTGKNMSASLSLAAASLQKRIETASSICTVFQYAVSEMMTSAHGNSGTILTLFFKGISDYLHVHTSEYQHPGELLANSYAAGAELAHANIPVPMDGTILTVALKSAHAGISISSFTSNPIKVLKRISEEAFSVLPLTALQNPVLKEFHVIDSGALGFCIILDGFLSAFYGCDIAVLKHDYTSFPLPAAAKSNPCSIRRYCTELLLAASNPADMQDLKNRILPLGDCILIAENDGQLKIHIHTDSPEAVCLAAKECGTILSRKIDDMLKETASASSEDTGSSPKIMLLLSFQDMVEFFDPFDYPAFLLPEDSPSAIKDILVKMQAMADEHTLSSLTLYTTVTSENLLLLKEYFLSIRTFQTDLLMIDALLAL